MLDPCPPIPKTLKNTVSKPQISDILLTKAPYTRSIKVNHVAKASFQWRYFSSLIQALPLLEFKVEALKQFSIRRWSGMGGWVLVTAGAAGLLYWNGRLVLATGAGVAVMMLIYLLHDWKLELPWAELRKFLDSCNQPFVLAVAGGGVATLTTYLAASIWMESESHWIASGAILQGAGTLAVLVLLIWQNLSRQANRDRVAYNQLLADLTHDDSLKRLIAVRQLAATVPDRNSDPVRRREVADYFRLMLNREAEPLIREAVLDGLHLIERVHTLKQATQPTIDPTAMTRSVARSRKRLPVR